MFIRVQSTAFPIAVLQECSLDEVNPLLVAWGHRMGPLKRPKKGDPGCHVLLAGGTPLAVTTTSTLIRLGAGAGYREILTRDNTVELSRLCSSGPTFNRVMLRLWRELVFPALGRQYAISYQDADIHNGNTYRFDGWLRLGYSRSGGVDRRSGRRGRNKWIWGWPADALRPFLNESARFVGVGHA